MTITRLLSVLAWSGVRLDLEPDGGIHVIGRLSAEQRRTIREHRDIVVARLKLNQGADSGHALGAAEALEMKRRG